MNLQRIALFCGLICLWIAPSIALANDPIDLPTEQVSTGTANEALPVWQAVALGVIEGATEFLPVSSTGHLRIFQHWLGKSASADESDAEQALAICIQLGAILAVVFLYFDRMKQMLLGLLGRDRDGKRLAINLIVAFLPAAIFGLTLGKLIKRHLLGIQPITIAIFVGAIIILSLPRSKPGQEEPSTSKDLNDLTWQQALIIGITQCFAFWPGFSRSLATILGCRMVGLRLAASVEFSFLLGFITLLAATAKEGAESGSKIIAVYGLTSPMIALVVAFVSAIISVKFMVGLLGRFGLAPFGYYRLALAAYCLTLW